MLAAHLQHTAPIFVSMPLPPPPPQLLQQQQLLLLLLYPDKALRTCLAVPTNL
jgi:hypothetical protein